MNSFLLVSAITWIVAISPTVSGAANEVTERAVPNAATIIQQPVHPSGTTIPTLTVDQRLAAMQQQMQALQTQMAILQSVLKIATDGAVTIQSQKSVSVQAGTDLSIGAGKYLSIGAGQNVTVQGNGTALVEGKGGLDLKGTLIKLNGGSKPVAIVGSQVQVPGQPIGQITTGSGTILGN